MHVNLTLTKTQADVVNRALDLFSRILIGQKYALDVVCARYKVNLSSPGAHGIYSLDVHDDARVAFDVHQVLRSCIAWHNQPEGGMTVDFSRPMQSSVTEPLPVARIIGVTEMLALLDQTKGVEHER